MDDVPRTDTDTAAAAGASPADRNLMGQKIGAKGARTRQKLIDVTVKLLGTRGLRDLTVAEVAKVAKTSTATFYVYFDTVQAVVLAALEQAPHTTAELLALVEEPWPDGETLERARNFVNLYTDLWSRNRTIFTVRNLAAEEGDERFLEARLMGAKSLIEAMAVHVQRAQAKGAVPAEVSPRAHAGALLMMLERLSSIGPMSKSSARIPYEDIRESAAHIVAQTLGADARS